MADSEDITTENVVTNKQSLLKNDVELVELGSSSDEEECTNATTSTCRNIAGLQAVRVFRPILPTWCGRSTAYIQQRIHAAQLQQRIQSRKRRNSNDYDVAEVSSEGRLLVNVGKPAGDPDVYIVDRLTNVLQPHQLQGVKFMYDNLIGSIAGCKESEGEGCILAHSMGLGKTLQVITFVEVFFRYTDFKRVIIVCPVNTIQNWANEFEKWLPQSATDGDESGRQFAVHLLNDSVKGGLVGRAAFVENWHKTGGVLLISYDMFKLLTGCSLQRKRGAKPFDGTLDAMINTGSDEPLKPVSDQQLAEFELRRKLRAALVEPGADMIVCDEGHQIKNMKTDKSASLNAVSTKRRVVLTGYPLQNNLQEYYCMVSFVRPGHLGSKKNFREMFEKPINAALAIDAKPSAIRLCKMRTHVLQMKLTGFVQRRTQHLLKKILPDSLEYVVLVRKSPIQQQIYRAFVAETNSDVFDQNSSFNPLRAHTICVKVLNHPDMLYFACEERKKRETQKQSRRVDSTDNSNSSNSMSNNFAIGEKNGTAIKNNDNNHSAASNIAGMPTSSSNVVCEGNPALTGWSFNQFQNSSSTSYACSSKSCYSTNFSPTNFCNFPQQPGTIFNGNMLNNYNNNNMGATLFPLPHDHQSNFTGANFSGEQFSSQWNGYGYLSNDQSSAINTTWGGEMGSFDANSSQFSLRQSLINSFNADCSQQPQQVAYSPLQPQNPSSQQLPEFVFIQRGNDVKPAVNVCGSANKFSEMSNGNNNYSSLSNMCQQTDVKFNVEQFSSATATNNNQPNHPITSVNKNSASGRFSDAIKTINHANDNNFSLQNGVRIYAVGSGSAPVRSTPTTFNPMAICPTIFGAALAADSSPQPLPAATSGPTPTNFCTLDDQRPSTSAEAIAVVKTQSNKSKRTTLGDALLDDDENIDNSIKLEWTRIPLHHYKPGVLENGSKMLLAFSIIDETTRRGEKILFFSSSVNTLNTFESFLGLRTVCGVDGPLNRWRKNVNYCRFDGRTTGVERERLINRFNSEPGLLLFLISTKAGSLGINLVSANRVIIFDASWNPCDDAQAICRIYRYGQRKRTYIYRLIMNNSMEKAIFHRQIAKSTLQQKVVDHQDIDANVSTKELESLFQYDEKADFKPIEKELDNWGLDDDLLMKVAREHTALFADVPFLHESLMLESEEKLSEEEKYEAELLYEREMRGGYLGGWSDGLDFSRYSTAAALLGSGGGNGVPDIGATAGFDGSGIVDLTGPPRLFPPDFAFSHPGAAAFNRAFRRLSEESMMIPPQTPYASPVQSNQTLADESQILANPTPYPKLFRADANASAVNDDEAGNEDGGEVRLTEPTKTKTLSEVLDSLMSADPAQDSSSSDSVTEVFSSADGGPRMQENPLNSRPPSIALLRRPTAMQHRPYLMTSDGRVIISQDIRLPSIRSSKEDVELKAGEVVILCQTANGTYLKTNSGELLDASHTIYALAPYLPLALQRRPVGGLTGSIHPPPGKKHRLAPDEVIELD